MNNFILECDFKITNQKGDNNAYSQFGGVCINISNSSNFLMGRVLGRGDADMYVFTSPNVYSGWNSHNTGITILNTWLHMKMQVENNTVTVIFSNNDNIVYNYSYTYSSEHIVDYTNRKNGFIVNTRNTTAYIKNIKAISL